MNHIEPGAMTIKAFCAKYSRSHPSVYRDIAAGKLRPVKAGARRTLITNEEAARWLSSLPTVKSYGAAA